MIFKSEKGVTLVELVCVIMLIGIIVVIAVPSLADFGQKRNLEMAARTLAIDMRKIRQKAITTGWNHKIEMRIYGDDYIIKDGKTSEQQEITLPPGISYRSNNFPIEYGRRVLSFGRSGAPNSGGTVALTNSAEDVLYVIVTPATGRVRIDDRPPAHW